ncbi:Alpha/Beta hydrolase protein [Dactylonectria macrodidyma]|uniref:Alpha/Beta hydrolase protein n=1 Tax=Dactylonectria macrodidyma TaxID=307937 RepID=A0A9P9EE58_9HYPO|nr:Alpha/Beta hydrolase protein [Dactylonectria macrodidyma]
MSVTKPQTPLTKASSATLRPPYDPLLMPAVEASKSTLPEILDVHSLRKIAGDFSLETTLKNCPNFVHSEHMIPGFRAGDAPVLVSIFKPKNLPSADLPAVYCIHGGGQVAGTRFSALDVIINYFEGIEVVIVAVEYRLAPEHRAPAALHDSYAGLVWTAEHAADLGIDPSKILILGGSGGAPITAGCAILCRNNKKPYPLAQMLLTPMLDDRDCTASSKQFARDGPWCGTTNRMAWGHVLGSARGGPDVSELVAPARATDLEGVAPAFIDAAECEVFRDEAVAYASQLWKCGVPAELHVWPGAYHGFDMLEQAAPVATAARDAKLNWIKRIFGACKAK